MNLQLQYNITLSQQRKSLLKNKEMGA